MRAVALAIALGALCAPAGRAPAADLITLRVATIPADSGSDVYYARDEGFFKTAGLNVTVDPIASGPAIIGAVSGGSYDIGAANTVAVAAARERGIAIRILAPGALHASANPTDLLMVAKTSAARTARDLDGKTIAVSSLGGLNSLAVQAWIAQNGGDAATIKLVEMPPPAMVAALTQGRVEAAEMAEPFITAVRDAARPLADANDAIADHFLIDAWIASDGWLAQHPDAAKRFAAAMRSAHLWANAHHKESAPILVRYLNLPLDTVESMTRAGFGTSLEPGLVDPLLAVAVRYKLLPQAIPAAELIWEAGSR